MKNLLHYIQNNYRKPENALMQIIITHFLIFFFLLLLKAGSFFSGSYELYEALLDKLCLSLDSSKTIRQPWTLITYSFLKIPAHLGLLSFLSLCLEALVISFWGNLLIGFFNSRRFLQVYILTSIIGGIAVALRDFYDPFPFTSQLSGLATPMYGLIASVATIMPNYTIYLFSSRVKVKYIPLFLLAYTLLSMLYTENQPQGIANLAAMLSGSLYILYLQKRGFKAFTATWWQSPFKRSKKTSKEKSYNKRRKKTQMTQEELTKLLDKVAQQGYQSLSLQEKQDLFEVS